MYLYRHPLHTIRVTGFLSLSLSFTLLPSLLHHYYSATSKCDAFIVSLSTRQTLRFQSDLYISGRFNVVSRATLFSFRTLPEVTPESWRHAIKRTQTYGDVRPIDLTEVSGSRIPIASRNVTVRFHFCLVRRRIKKENRVRVAMGMKDCVCACTCVKAEPLSNPLLALFLSLSCCSALSAPVESLTSFEWIVGSVSRATIDNKSGTTWWILPDTTSEIFRGARGCSSSSPLCYG